MNKDVIRWIGRTLGHPSILRLVWDNSNPRPYTFLYALDHIPADVEHPESHRGAVHVLLADWVQGVEADPVECWGRVYCRLRSLYLGDSFEPGVSIQIVRDALQSRFPVYLLADQTNVESNTPPEDVSWVDWVETHAHLRGSVRFDTMLNEWIADQRYTKALRKLTIEWKSWKITVADAVHKLRSPSGDQVRSAAGISSTAVEAPVWVSIAIHVALHQHFTCVREIPGLAAFTKSYDRFGKGQKRPNVALWHEYDTLLKGVSTSYTHCTMPPAPDNPTAPVQIRTVGIELRPTLERLPVDNLHRLRNLILAYLNQLQQLPPNTDFWAMGLAASLFKQDKSSLRHGREHDQDNWKQQIILWENQVEGVLSLCEREPAIRMFLLGFDMAGQEMGCPPWVFRTCVNKIREYNRRHAMWKQLPKRRIQVHELPRNDSLSRAWDALNQSRVPFSRLGITVHAGEDFIDPMTGLRHIWEAVVDLGLYRGDRIGHGVAAALSEGPLSALLDRRGKNHHHSYVKTEKNGTLWRIKKPRGTHLADLMWEFRVCSDDEVSGLEAMYADCLGRTAGAAAPPNRVKTAAYHSAGSDRITIPGVRFLDPEDIDPSDWEWVTLDTAWLKRFDRRRQSVLQKLISKQVTIESCPTSNIVVCNLSTPPLVEFLEYPDLHVTLALDNAGLCDTSIAQDLALCLKEVPGSDRDRKTREILDRSCQWSFFESATDVS